MIEECKCEVTNNALYRHTAVARSGSITTWKKDLIITKEEFLECFNEWVVKPKRKNPVSISTEFYIPTDNGGGTLV